MRIEKLNVSKYKRFFAFGCSFTYYRWPTWADIIGAEIPYYENWGKGAAGNHFIFNSLIEANNKFNFTKDDLVIICWTSVLREDRYVNGEWIHASNVQREEIYGKQWMEKFGFEIRGNMIRDYAFIDAGQKLLESLKCDWANFNSIPIVQFDQSKAVEHFGNEKDAIKFYFDYQSLLTKENFILNYDVIEQYKHIFSKITRPMFELVYSKDSPTYHPSPQQYFNYLGNHLPNNLQNNIDIQRWEKKVVVANYEGNFDLDRKFINRL